MAISPFLFLLTFERQTEDVQLPCYSLTLPSSWCDLEGKKGHKGKHMLIGHQPVRWTSWPRGWLSAWSPMLHFGFGMGPSSWQPENHSPGGLQAKELLESLPKQPFEHGSIYCVSRLFALEVGQLGWVEPNVSVQPLQHTQLQLHVTFSVLLKLMCASAYQLERPQYPLQNLLPMGSTKCKYLTGWVVDCYSIFCSSWDFSFWNPNPSTLKEESMQFEEDVWLV